MSATVSPAETIAGVKTDTRLKMDTFLISLVLAGLCAIVLWIARLVKDLNERFDQIDNALDLILDHLKQK